MCDYEELADILAGRHFVALPCLMLAKGPAMLDQGSEHLLGGVIAKLLVRRDWLCCAPGQMPLH